MSTKKNEPDHPALQPLALLVNEIHNRKVSGAPRAIAQKIIDMVFAKESELWEDSEILFEGGEVDSLPNRPVRIQQTGSQTEGTHHRKVIVFYGPWKKGSPRVPNGHPLTGETGAQPASAPPEQFKEIASKSQAAAKAFRSVGVAAQSLSAGTHLPVGDLIVDRRADGSMVINAGPPKEFTSDSDVDQPRASSREIFERMRDRKNQ